MYLLAFYLEILDDHTRGHALVLARPCLLGCLPLLEIAKHRGWNLYQTLYLLAVGIGVLTFFCLLIVPECADNLL